MRGCILAGGLGSRLAPLTHIINKNLLPVGRKFLLEYTIEKMVEAGITDIAITTGAEHAGSIIELCRSGKKYGCTFTYVVQEEPGGISQAIGLVKNFARGDSLMVILGDNLFDDSLVNLVKNYQPGSAAVCIKTVNDPERFGVVEYSSGIPTRIIEKPEIPPSNDAVIGVYVYPEDVFDNIATLKPSARGELEVTDLNNIYLESGRMNVHRIDGFWIDAGNHKALMEANLWAYKKEGYERDCN